jgi:hypothetical protein
MTGSIIKYSSSVDELAINSRKNKNITYMKKQQEQKSDRDKKSVKGKTDHDGREHLNQREENLQDNKVSNDEDSNIGRGKYLSKYGNGKTAEPSTKGGETE